jgi:23S rRNA G2445 N2-methylase RlmL
MELTSSVPGACNIVKGKCGVKFQGDDSVGFSALLNLRTSLKLMELVSTSNDITTKKNLYDWCYQALPWSDLMSVDQSLKCDTVLHSPSSELSHSHFTSLTIKNAIIDNFRDRTGIRPSVDIDDPDVPIHVYINRDKASLYRVWSGDSSMHKRGYRNLIHKAALRETTAAAL